jgi:hypothetical protein
MRFLCLVVVGAMIVGCPSSDGPACSDYQAPASFDVSTPVSFKNEIVLGPNGIFFKACAFVSCHGAEQGASNGVFLGGLDASKVRAGLVDQPSEELPTMAKVKAGAPHDSYLMRKLDGSNCVLASQCVETANTQKGDCGVSMPRNSDPLSQTDRDKVRRWILQGALDN